MSIAPFDPAARVCLAIVALGTPQRLKDCLDSLAGHTSSHDFSVICVINSASGADTASDFDFPPEVHVVRAEANLGWPGGLHLARAAITAEYMVWVQEDMRVLDGWLDALVDSADAHPEIAAFGSLTVDADGRPTAISAGRAEPFHEVARWNETDSASTASAVGVTPADWVTSKGMLTRTSAWDTIGGPDPRLYPLNHVDKDYATHLRAHGLSVALVPSARLFHLQGQSAPSMFRRFISEYRDPSFNAQWGPVAELLASTSAPVAHECAPWFGSPAERANPVATITAVAAREAGTMLIAFAKWANRFTDVSVEHQRNVDAHELSVVRAELESRVADLQREIGSLEAEVALLASTAAAASAAHDRSTRVGSDVKQARDETATAYESTVSWRVTRPLRALRSLTRR